MQFHSPSSVQALPIVCSPAVEVVPLEEDEEEAADDAAAGAAAATETEDVAAAVEDPTVTKTPPGMLVAVATADVVRDAAEVTADVPDVAVAAAPPVPAVAEPDSPATAAWQALPLGLDNALAVANPSCSTESPGFGKRRSVESTVRQPFPMFAVNISGRASNAEVSRASNSSLLLDDDPVRVTGAQFMYISRLPTLLNQVHARVALPVGTVSGILKL
jgi:hypothetical protein